MMGFAIAYDPCQNCDKKEMCSMCELTMRRNGAIKDEELREQEWERDGITDLLIAFDEMGFQPTTLHPDPEAYAVEWKRKLIEALKCYRKQSEGEWIENKKVCSSPYCSICGAIADKSPYCPHCGAKMKRR